MVINLAFINYQFTYKVKTLKILCLRAFDTENSILANFYIKILFILILSFLAINTLHNIRHFQVKFCCHRKRYLFFTKSYHKYLGNYIKNVLSKKQSFATIFHQLWSSTNIWTAWATNSLLCTFVFKLYSDLHN